MPFSVCFCRTCLALLLILVLTGATKAQIQFDPTFGTNGIITFDFGGAFDDIEGISIAPDGKIYASGTGGTSNRFAVARLTSGGQLDGSFSGDGKLIIGASAGSGAVQGLDGGKVLLGVPRLTPSPSGYQAIKLNNDGSFDSTFGTDGVGFIQTGSQVGIKDLMVQPDGKVLIAGHDFFSDGWNFVLARFNADGTPDSTFGTNGRVITDFSRPAIQNPTDRSETFLLQPDGKILAGGFSATTSAESTGNRIHAIARYLPDGSLDSTFGSGGKQTFTFDTGSFQSELVGGLALQPDGKILGTSNGGSTTALFRLNSNGSVDNTFGTGGRIIAPTGSAWRDPGPILLDNQGRILLGDSGKFAVTRLLPDGALDATFGTSGTLTMNVGTVQGSAVTDMEFDVAGNLVVGGYSTVTSNVDSNWHVARIALGLPSPVQTVSLAPLFDVKASVWGTIRSVTDGEASLFAGLGFDASNPEERPIFEFPISGIPAGAAITAATLTVDPYASSGTPRLEVQAFAGDGVASLSDITSPATIAGTTGPVSASDNLIEIQLTPSVLQALLDDGDFLGLRIRSLDVPEYVGFGASEATFGTPPRLTLTYEIPQVPGDFTVDGLVTAADLTAWKAAYGKGQGADADKDGDTDGADFLLWQRQLGSASAAKAGAAVPEPTAILLTLAAGLALAPRRRHRCRSFLPQRLGRIRRGD
jgi:uncharacterized delta-60 repeat protein